MHIVIERGKQENCNCRKGMNQEKLEKRTIQCFRPATYHKCVFNMTCAWACEGDWALFPFRPADGVWGVFQYPDTHYTIKETSKEVAGNGQEYKITPQEKEELSLVPKINREENEVHGLLYFFQNATAVKKQLSQRVVHLVMWHLQII